MSRFNSNAMTTALIGAGALAWAFAGRPLLADADLNSPPNPMGIKRSPYGEVFAMAMQGPIDQEFHAGMFGTSGHHHADGSTCSDCAENAAKAAASPENASLRQRWVAMLDSLASASQERTNPKPAGEGLKRYLRRQAEDKLRFAYQLDPAHYANYNSLHFFITEPAVGTRPELTPSAAKLAQETIDYCLKQDNDPRPALTAAAAAGNVLDLMFSDRHNPSPRYTTAQMRQCLDLLGHCLARYDHISRQWEQSGNWNLLSPMRIAECHERHDFMTRIREAAEKTILRLEAETSPSPTTPQVFN